MNGEHEEDHFIYIVCVSQSANSDMVVRGWAPFWLMCTDGMIQCIYIERQRVDAHELEEMAGVPAAAIFLCCHTLASERTHFCNQGMLGMLKHAGIWKLICFYEIDLTKEVMLAFQYAGEPASSLWSD